MLIIHVSIIRRHVVNLSLLWLTASRQDFAKELLERKREIIYPIYFCFCFTLVYQQVSIIGWYLGDDVVAHRHPEKNAVPSSVYETVSC